MQTDYCVYAHINKKNRKMYIGISKNIEKRWRPSSYCQCKYFYRAIQKYGWDGFEHIIIIDSIQREVAYECEKELIKKFNTTDRACGYNLARGGSGGATTHGEDHYLSKYVYQYNLEGSFIKKWINAQEASKILNIVVSDIHATARGLIKQAGGYQWSYKYLDKMPVYPGHWGLNKKQYPPVYKVSYSGNIEEKYKTLHDISNEQRIIQDIRSCCYKKRLSAFGYFWMFDFDYSKEYVDELILRHNMRLEKKICMYDLSGNLIKVFESKKEASDYSGYKRGSILHACAACDGYHRNGNYLWYYLNDTNGQNVNPWKCNKIDD